MKNISLNGQWNIFFDGEKNINEKNYFQGEKRTSIVPEAIEKILEDRIFSGPFFYEKEIFIEEVNNNNCYLLEFLGVSYYCEVYLNGNYIQSHEGLWDNFKVDITEYLQVGGNKVLVKVIKPDFNKDSKYFYRSLLFGFIPDISIPFGGIWKDVNLLVRGKNYFNEANYKFDVDNKCIIIDSKLNSVDDGEHNDINLEVEIGTPEGGVITKHMTYSENIVLAMDNIKVWSPDKPYLYTVKVKLLKDECNGEIQDYKEIRAGFRKVELRDGEIHLNDEKFYMRGILHWGAYPEKFTPTPSYEEVKAELLKIKSLGFNTIKHCLYFPPAYYYELCDELGIVTWQEMPLWLPYKNSYLLNRIYTEYPKMLNYFMHYPSVSLVSLSCELDATISSNVLNDLYKMVKSMDKDMIICDNSGSGECFEGVTNSESDIYDYHFYAELYNLDGLINEFTRSYRPLRPWIFGEYNDCDTFRTIEDIKKHSDYELWWLNPDERKNLLRMTHKGFNSDLPIYHQEEIIAKYGIQEEVKAIKEISYQQSYMMRKYILELTRSYKEIKGYNITAIRDVSITTSGIFDDNMESKFSAEEFSKINGDVVVALSKNLTRIWDNGADRFLNQDLYNYFSEGNLIGKLVVSNRKNKDLDGKYTVTLKDDKEVYFTYEDKLNIDKNVTTQLAELNIKLPKVEETRRLKLCVNLVYKDESYENHWDIWVYNDNFSNKLIYLFDNTNALEGIEERFNIKRVFKLEDLYKLNSGDLLITTYFDKGIEALGDRGVNILYYQKGEGYFPLTYNPFFREGIKKIFSHSITNTLNHLGYGGYQFYGVGTDRYYDKLQLEEIIGKYTPIIRRYDARKFKAGDYIFEYKRNKGTIIATTLNLDGGKGSQPYNFKYNIMAQYLLNSIIEYLK